MRNSKITFTLWFDSSKELLTLTSEAYFALVSSVSDIKDFIKFVLKQNNVADSNVDELVEYYYSDVVEQAEVTPHLMSNFVEDAIRKCFGKS